MRSKPSSRPRGNSPYSRSRVCLMLRLTAPRYHTGRHRHRISVCRARSYCIDARRGFPADPRGVDTRRLIVRAFQTRPQSANVLYWITCITATARHPARLQRTREEFSLPRRLGRRREGLGSAFRRFHRAHGVTYGECVGQEAQPPPAAPEWRTGNGSSSASRPWVTAAQPSMFSAAASRRRLRLPRRQSMTRPS
jgi:hypothetical protein